MKGAGPVRYRRDSCRAEGCGAVFYVCSRCDRGQRYCSEACRRRSRRRQCREANRRHQQSPEGRLDHRSRQRAYRLRQAERRWRAQKSVTDQASPHPPVHVTIPLTESVPLPAAAVRRRERPRLARPPRGPVICWVCGRSGRWLNPFQAPG